MNLISPSKTNSAKLSDFYGQIVALSFVRDADVTTKFGRTVVPEASLVTINLEEGRLVPQGSTLVFPSVVAQNVRNGRGGYVVGRLTVTERANGRTLILLEDLTEAELETAANIFTANVDGADEDEEEL